MTNTLSKVVFGIACVAVPVTALFSLLWFSIVVDHDGRSAVVTRSMVGPFLGGGLLVLAVVPGGWLFFRGRQRRDMWSFAVSGLSFLAVLGETVALFFVRLHGPW